MSTNNAIAKITEQIFSLRIEHRNTLLKYYLSALVSLKKC